MNKLVFCLALLLSGLVQSAHAVCNSSFVNPLTDTCWECLFPIRLAGVRISPSSPDPESYLSTSLCSCQDGAIQRVGLAMGFREPAFAVDVVKDAWCFATFGVDMGKSSVWGDGSSINGGDGYGQRSEYSVHTHSYFYNPLFLLELLMDARCLDKSPIGISDISEVRPEHLDGQLNLMLYPQTLLFANPVALAACMADTVAATAGHPVDALFWCAGEWRPIYPLTGYSSAKGAGCARS